MKKNKGKDGDDDECGGYPTKGVWLLNGEGNHHCQGKYMTVWITKSERFHTESQGSSLLIFLIIERAKNVTFI